MAPVHSRVIGFCYKRLLKPLFFRLDPENVHDRMTRIGSFLGRFKPTRVITKAFFSYEHPSLVQHIHGLTFKNPVGLAAGFDKNAELVDVLPSVGFGFMEVGSITGKMCLGNPKPRLWRLPKSESLLVYYGLKNDGAEAISKKLSGKTFDAVLGTSVAMTNCQENIVIKNAVLDYKKAFEAFKDIGDYTTVNISCPNTLGGQPFLEPYHLDYLFDVLDEVSTTKPVFVKLAPDATDHQIDSILDVLKKHRVDGIICTNLTKKRDNPKIKDKDFPSVGGMSGKIVEDLADKLLAYIYNREGKRFILIGCGGIFSAEDAYKKIRLGASLVQLVTGMIYNGPQLIGDINRGLVELLKRDGFSAMSEAVGIDNGRAMIESKHHEEHIYH